jgi:hypothetical protein
VRRRRRGNMKRIRPSEQIARATALRRKSRAMSRISTNVVIHHAIVRQAAFLTRHLYDPDAKPAKRFIAEPAKGPVTLPPKVPNKPRIKVPKKRERGRWDPPARPRACRVRCRWANNGINKRCEPGACRAAFRNVRDGKGLDSFARIHAGRDRGAADYWQLAAMDLVGEAPSFETVRQRADGGQP